MEEYDVSNAALYGGHVDQNGNDDDEDDNTQQAASDMAEAITAQAEAASSTNEDYRKARDSELLEVRTRQLKALQQDYLRLHEHTLQQAHYFAESNQRRQEELERTEASLESMRKQLADMRGQACLLYTSPSPRDGLLSRMPSSA